MRIIEDLVKNYCNYLILYFNLQQFCTKPVRYKYYFSQIIYILSTNSNNYKDLSAVFFLSGENQRCCAHILHPLTSTSNFLTLMTLSNMNDARNDKNNKSISNEVHRYMYIHAMVFIQGAFSAPTLLLIRCSTLPSTRFISSTVTVVTGLLLQQRKTFVVAFKSFKHTYSLNISFCIFISRPAKHKRFSLLWLAQMSKERNIIFRISSDPLLFQMVQQTGCRCVSYYNTCLHPWLSYPCMLGPFWSQ